MRKQNSASPHSIVFYGTPDFAAICLRALLQDARFQVKAVVTQPDKAAGRGAKLSSPPVKVLAAQHAIRVFQPNRLKKESVALIESLNCLGPFDLGVVVAFGQIIPQTLLDLPKHGCVNVHASLLPRWRGAAPIQRALLAGDRQTGVCLMQMEAGLDCGPVYSRQQVEIGAQDNFGILHDSLAQLGADLLTRDAEKIINGEIKAGSQSEDGLTYAHKIDPAETKIDWRKSALEIERQVRAFSPYPGAYTMLEGKRLKILAAQRKACRIEGPLHPGKVHYVDRLTLELECAAEVLSLQEVQLEGKKRLNIKEFLLGAKLTQNMLLGN